MKKILYIFFMIAFIGLQVCLALTIFDPYGEWLVSRIFRAITFGTLLVTYPLISVNDMFKGVRNED